MSNKARLDLGRDGATATSVLAWPAVGLAAARGVSSRELAAEAGLELSALADSASRVPLRAVQRLWSLTAERFGEPHIGLASLEELGATSPTSWPDPVALYEHLFSSSPTLGLGIDRARRFVRLLRDGFDVYIFDRDGRSAMRFDFAEGETYPLIQLHLGMSMLMKRRVLPHLDCVSEVWLTEPTPADPAPYERFFGVPLRFGAPYAALVSPRPLWDEALPTADETRCARSQWRAEALLEKLPDPERTSDRVRLAVRQALSSGDVRVDAVAKRLALSPRTLHRRLASEGESYQQLLDEARRQRAMRELASSNLSVKDVGERVGFRNASAFHRAFKAWTGLTPNQFRERHSPPEDEG